MGWCWGEEGGCPVRGVEGGKMEEGWLRDMTKGKKKKEKEKGIGFFFFPNKK